MRRRPAMIAFVIFFGVAFSRVSAADPFTDAWDGLTRISGLRGIIKGIAGGASEGVREQLDRFIDEKIDPLVGRIDQILHDRIQQATDGAVLAIHEAERAMCVVIDQASRNINDLSAQFFLQLDQTLDQTLSRVETMLDDVLCHVMPDGQIHIDLGPFGGHDQIRVKRPAQTQCYRDFLASHADPAEATFRRWEYFAGELCENELLLNRIEPTDPASMAQVVRGYQKLSEMARTARCVAPDPSSKMLMAEKLYRYQSRAGFFAKLSGVSQ